jgi:hypothetical protein
MRYYKTLYASGLEHMGEGAREFFQGVRVSPENTISDWEKIKLGGTNSNRDKGHVRLNGPG